MPRPRAAHRGQPRRRRERRGDAREARDLGDLGEARRRGRRRHHTRPRATRLGNRWQDSAKLYFSQTTEARRVGFCKQYRGWTGWELAGFPGFRGVGASVIPEKVPEKYPKNTRKIPEKYPPENVHFKSRNAHFERSLT